MADKFRRATVPRHVRIYHRQMQSEAWRHLSGSAVKVLLALAALEKGDNNGDFYLSVRMGAELTGLSKNAVNRAFHELQEKGFIYCAVRGGFSRKTPHAACWGLTWQAGPKGTDHRAPSHAYEKWRPKNFPGPQNRDTAVPETKTSVQMQAPGCPADGDSESTSTAENCQTPTVSKAGTHTSNQSLESDCDITEQSETYGGISRSFGWWQSDHHLSMARLVYSGVLTGLIRQAISERRLAA